MPPRLQILALDLYERHVPFARPFRFGAVTVHGAAQALVRAEIQLADGTRGIGGAAELMAPKWFDKNPALSAADTVNGLRQALTTARALYLQGGPDTAFGLHATRIEAQLAANPSLPELAACFGPALIDKAVLDALGRALGLDVFNLLSRNLMGLDARLTPDLRNDVIDTFLCGRSPLPRVAIRHTVGLLDDLAALPAEIAETGCRYFKLKLCGEPDADRARLTQIAAVLSAAAPDCRVTLDANEQYRDITALDALVDALDRDPALRFVADRLLYLEQPLPRETTRTTPLGPIADGATIIIDEADDSYGAFPAALAQGYRGCSSKSCKGIYKSLLNGARCAVRTAAGQTCIMTAEDLTCPAGLAVQQDTALVAFHGITHAERNGHHYADGFAGAPDDEAARFAAAHPDFYRAGANGPVLRIADGLVATGSLATPGFASAVLPDWGALAPLGHSDSVETAS